MENLSQKSHTAPLIEAADGAHTGGGLLQRTSSGLYKIPSHRSQDEECEEFLRNSGHDGAELVRDLECVLHKLDGSWWNIKLQSPLTFGMK